MPETFMRRALRLARDNLGSTSPNPSVGALVVRNREIISYGVTQPAGQEHAEVAALRNCDAKEADLYVTLEPCCHQGRTGPCTRAIIDAGVSRVFIAVRDRNPIVDGRGVDALRQEGVEVITGVLEDEASRFYEPYFHWTTTGRPYVTLKIAQTLDGKMTWSDGRKKRITGKSSDEFSHRLRKEHDAILVGINTVLKDDPRLTCRLVDGPDPVRVVLDSSLRLPLDAKLLQEPGYTVVFCTENYDAGRYDVLKNRCDVVVLDKLEIDEVLDALGELQVTSVLVEGGPTVAGSFLVSGAVGRMHILVGSFSVGEGEGLRTPFRLEDVSSELLGNDVLITGRVKYE